MGFNMLKPKMKRTLCAMAAVLSIAGTITPVLADRVDFDITVSVDEISPRAKKADSEQKYYVTGTYFSLTNYTFSSKSVNLNNSALKSQYTAAIKSSSPKATPGYGKYYAGAGVYHYLQAVGGVSGLRVRGRYTP